MTENLSSEVNGPLVDLASSLTSAVRERNDGDIIIYIRQPKSRKTQVNPKITVDVTESFLMSNSDLEKQTIQVNEIQPKPTLPGRKFIPRKSKSENFPKKFSSSSSEEESNVSKKDDSNEEEVIDTTHYNLTLKSETVVDLDKVTRVKTKSRVDLKQPHQHSSRPATTASSASPGSTVSPISPISSNTGSSSYEEPSIDDSSAINLSPIKISTSATTLKRFPKLQFVDHWNAKGDALLINNGRTLRAVIIDEHQGMPLVRGAPFKGNYIFSEVHFHWGAKDCCGAEHIIDGQRHTLEAHFEYYKEEYEDLVSAKDYEDGVAVIAVFFNVGAPPNSLFGVLIKDISLLQKAKSEVVVPAYSLFSWMKDTVENGKCYYSYKGTLTVKDNPKECVTWIIFPDPIPFCCQQSREFRKLKKLGGDSLLKNWRYPQPLNNRPVYFVQMV